MLRIQGLEIQKSKTQISQNPRTQNSNWEIKFHKARGESTLIVVCTGNFSTSRILVRLNSSLVWTQTSLLRICGLMILVCIGKSLRQGIHGFKI